jgi:hypothetical protein
MFSFVQHWQELNHGILVLLSLFPVFSPVGKLERLQLPPCSSSSVCKAKFHRENKLVLGFLWPDCPESYLCLLFSAGSREKAHEMLMHLSVTTSSHQKRKTAE